MMQFVISRKFLDAVIEGQIFMHPKFRVPLSLPVPAILPHLPHKVRYEKSDASLWEWEL